MWLGESIKQRRKTLGWTAEEAARKIGISASHLYKIEANERLPKLDILKYISQAYKVPMWVFLFCYDDDVKVEKEIEPAYKGLRKSVAQIVKEFL